MAGIRTNLKHFRVNAGFSQQALARLAGISRQAYAALESGGATPSTEVALRLARALRTSVESLFSLEEEPPTVVHAELLGVPDLDPPEMIDGGELLPHPPPPLHFMERGPGGEALTVGAEARPHGPRRVRLMRVGHRWLARPLWGPVATSHSLVDAEGLVLAWSGEGNRVAIQPFDEQEGETPTLVLLGCDPAAALLQPALQRQGVRLVWTEESSREALTGLTRGEAHVAGCHLRDDTTGGYNVSWVRRLVPFPCTLVTFAAWHQGLIVAAGNPKQIYSVADLARPGVTIVNRQPGSGSRSLLDRLLQRAGIPASAIAGYHREVRGHLAVAEAVASGLVDAGIGVQVVATAMELGFVPLDQERYDLVIPNHFLNERGVQTLLDLLRQPGLRRRVETLGGYDVAPMGSPPSDP